MFCRTSEMVDKSASQSSYPNERYPTLRSCLLSKLSYNQGVQILNVNKNNPNSWKLGIVHVHCRVKCHITR